MIVYVAGYPKSGTTWITRLLGDALDCRTGGSMPSEDRNEIATEGHDRNPHMTVRKGHFVVSHEPTANPVTHAHRLNWKGLRPAEHRVILVVRDPRDIAVSGSYHWRVSISRFINDMIRGTNGLRRIGPLCVYMKAWLEMYEKFAVPIVRYEDMLESPRPLARVLEQIGFDLSAKRIREAYDRQSFKKRREHIMRRGQNYNLGKDFNLRFMRKGIAGDWRNHFNRAEAFETEAHFGDLLRYFNYESNPKWWKEIR